MLSRGAFLGVIRALQSNINIYIPPACNSHIQLKLCLAAGGASIREQAAPNNSVCTLYGTTVCTTVWYHKLPPPREYHVCYSATRKAKGQVTWRVGSNVYV
jgi:hypothetical protein